MSRFRVKHSRAGQCNTSGATQTEEDSVLCSVAMPEETQRTWFRFPCSQAQLSRNGFCYCAESVAAWIASITSTANQSE